MKLTRQQHGNATLRDADGNMVPQTTSSPRYTRNLRPCADGWESTCPAAVRCLLGARPVFSDVRDAVTYVFTLSEGNLLSIGARCDTDGTWSVPATRLCRLPSPVTDCAPVGSFLVLRLADATLFYLHYNAATRGYDVLGLPPTLPGVRLERTSLRSVSVTVPGVTFRTPVADMRTGVPDAVATDVAATVRTASQSLEDSMELQHYWTQPVAVRVAVRLWDSSLLWLSPPLYAPESLFQESARVLLPLVYGEQGATGTSTALLGREAWRITLAMDGGDLARWEGIIDSVEIWVGEQQELLDDGAQPGVAYNATSSGGQLAVTHAMLPADVLVEGCAATRLQLAASLSVSDLGVPVEISRPDSTVYRKDPRSESLATLSLRCTSACGHAGYLHLAGVGSTLPAPPMPQSTGEHPCLCEVAVCVAGQGGERWLRASGTVGTDADGALVPALWYPSRYATEMRVALTLPGGERRTRSFPLHPLSGSEDCSVWVSGSLAPTVMESQPGVELPEASTEATLPDSLLTTARGNPFVVRSLTESVGGGVRFICAQPVGGGAFTRQYIYAFTDRGIVAVTHDIEGRHKNLRFISSRRVTDRTAVAASPSGLLVLTMCGSLLRISDSRVRGLFHAVPDMSRLAYDERHEELWLVPQEGSELTASMVVSGDLTGRVADLRATMRTVVPQVLLSAGGMLLFGAQSGEAWQLCHADADGADASAEASLWVSGPMTYRGARGKMVSVELTTLGYPVTVCVRGLPPVSSREGDALERGVVLGRATVPAGLTGTVRLPVMVPDIAFAPGMAPAAIEVTVSGPVGYLGDVQLR